MYPPLHVSLGAAGRGIRWRFAVEVEVSCVVNLHDCLLLKTGIKNHEDYILQITFRWNQQLDAEMIST
jgi:hypothetical protein